MAWTQSNINNQQPSLIVCIIATILHGAFWFQLVFCSSVRQRSMQWIYAYLLTDILLLFRFFFVYIIHSTSKDCPTNEVWALLMCYFEATVDNYLNVLEVYILLALNICRYVQIAYNRNVYIKDLKLLFFAHLTIYLIPLITLIIQSLIGWAKFEHFIDDICDVRYTNVYVQIFNTIISFVLPIALNIVVIYISVRHVQITSRLRKTQHYVSAREKYHRSLVIQFLCFYIIWLTLWSPNVVVYQFTSGKSVLTTNARLISFIEISLDPFIIGALDVRFWHAWKKVWLNFKKKYLKCLQAQERQIRPVVANIIVKKSEKQQETPV
jgi:hypothetical protein